MSNDHHEEKLTGGNVSAVYRVGNTVRRTLKPESLRIHRLLKHLEDKQFHYAPKFLGIDEQGREILSFLQGEAGNYPVKGYMWSESSLKKIAKILRHYHDAVVILRFDKDWEPIDHTPKPFEVICHNDFALYNIIFQQQKPVGVIDFDVAGPGPKAWDIAYTLYTCVPLSRFYWAETGEAVYYNSLQDADRTKQRILLFLEAYGDSTEQDYIGMVIRRLEGLCRTIQRKAQAGDKQFQKMMDEGHVKHYQCDIEFIHQHRTEWV